MYYGMTLIDDNDNIPGWKKSKYFLSKHSNIIIEKGIDNKGDIIICSNLFDIPDIKNFRIMLSGTPKELVSKFKISYHLIIHILLTVKSNSFIDMIK